jgi:cysteine desulfurase
MTRSIYLDNNSTTPLDPQVYERMTKVMRDNFGNPSSLHRWGNDSLKLVEEARERVANLIGAKNRQIYFTSGATESNNLVIRGIVPKIIPTTSKIITTAIEHEAVTQPVRSLETLGYQTRFLKPDSFGVISTQALKAEVSENDLYTEIAAHNEFGTIQPIFDHAEVIKNANAFYFLDAAQLIGKHQLNVTKSKIDFLSMSAHKFYGPKGVGAVFVKSRPVDSEGSSLLQGGGQEHGLRSGTLNVPAIVGMGEAALIAAEKMATEETRIASLKNKMWEILSSNIKGISLNGHPTERISGNLNFTVKDIDANAVLNLVPHLGISTGSACNSDSISPSPSLLALGLSESAAFSTLRICIGRFTTEEEIEIASRDLIKAYKTLYNAKI